MTGPDRWSPDHQLVPAYLAGRRPEVSPSLADRAWSVAGLTLAGKTADDIAARLGCSLRLIRAIRGEPMTQVCLFYQRESSTFRDEIRLARSELRAAQHTIAMLEAEIARIKQQLANLIGPRQFRCGHSTDRYNVYEHHGRRYCRTCRRQHSAGYTERKSQGLPARRLRSSHAGALPVVTEGSGPADHRPVPCRSRSGSPRPHHAGADGQVLSELADHHNGHLTGPAAREQIGADLVDAGIAGGEDDVVDIRRRSRELNV